jgi:hypothetical protein
MSAASRYNLLCRSRSGPRRRYPFCEHTFPGLGKSLGWYGCQNPPAPPESDIVSRGDATKQPVQPATFWDGPGWKFGGLTWKFDLFAIAKNGNGGQVLGGLQWGFTVSDNYIVKNTPPSAVTDYTDLTNAY